MLVKRGIVILLHAVHCYERKIAIFISAKRHYDHGEKRKQGLICTVTVNASSTRRLYSVTLSHCSRQFPPIALLVKLHA